MNHSCNQQQRPLPQLIDIRDKSRLGIAEAALLRRLQQRTRLDEDEAQGAAEFRHGGRGAQAIPH